MTGKRQKEEEEKEKKRNIQYFVKNSYYQCNERL